MKRPAVFMDRDGTINEQMGYINHVSRFVLLPRATEAIRLLNKHGLLSIVISNQSGVARGYFPLDLVHEVHARMQSMLKERGVHIDGVYFCPHHPEGVVPEYSKVCACRKPGTGLIERACTAFDIDMENSFVVGDRFIDVEMARSSGLKGILVLTGYGLGEKTYAVPKGPSMPVHIADDLFDAIQWIVGEGLPRRSKG